MSTTISIQLQASDTDFRARPLHQSFSPEQEPPSPFMPSFRSKTALCFKPARKRISVTHHTKDSLEAEDARSDLTSGETGRKVEERKLGESGSGGSLFTVQGMRTVTSSHLGEVTVKPASAFHRISTVASTEKQNRGSIETFWQGRNVLNRLMLEAIRERQQLEALIQLRSKAELQRSNSQLRSFLKKKQRKEVVEEAADRRKLLKATSQQDIKRKTLVELKLRERLRSGVRTKKVRTQSKLSVTWVDMGAIPEASKTLSLGDLQRLLTDTKPKRFRFK